MRRKINRVGQNTLTVSLPSKWVKTTGLKAGDEIDVVEDNKSLIISSEGKSLSLNKKRAKVNVDGFCKVMVSRIIQELYFEGLDEIEIRYNESYIDDFKKGNKIKIDQHINKLLNRLIGIEIIEQSTGKIILGSLMDHETVSDVNIIQKRLFFLIKNLVDEFLLALDENFEEFNKGLYDYHDNITKFTLYYLRLLKSSNISDGKKMRLFSLFMAIDGIIDKIRHTGERIVEIKKITKLTKETISDCFGLFIEFFDMILKSKISLPEIKKIINKRYNLVNKVLKTKYNTDEIKITMEARVMLDIMGDFLEAYTSINLDKMIEND